VETARRSDEKEPAALWQSNAAIREALFDNEELARNGAAAALALAPESPDAEAQSALAFALAGVRRALNPVWMTSINASLRTR